jgi:hypothetical protein
MLTNVIKWSAITALLEGVALSHSLPWFGLGVASVTPARRKTEAPRT